MEDAPHADSALPAATIPSIPPLNLLASRILAKDEQNSILINDMLDNEAHDHDRSRQICNFK